MNKKIISLLFLTAGFVAIPATIFAASHIARVPVFSAGTVASESVMALPLSDLVPNKLVARQFDGITRGQFAVMPVSEQNEFATLAQDAARDQILTEVATLDAQLAPMLHDSHMSPSARVELLRILAELRLNRDHAPELDPDADVLAMLDHAHGRATALAESIYRSLTSNGSHSAANGNGSLPPFSPVPEAVKAFEQMMHPHSSHIPTIDAVGKVYLGYGFNAELKRNGMPHTFYTHPADPTRIRATVAVDGTTTGRDLSILRTNITHLLEMYGLQETQSGDEAGEIEPREISLEKLRAVLLASPKKREIRVGGRSAISHETRVLATPLLSAARRQ